MSSWYVQWSPAGRVTFNALSFTAAARPAARPVRLAAVYYRPAGTTSGTESVQRAAGYAEQFASAHQPDVMVLGELLNVIGAPGSLDSKAEPVPGPSTDVMAAVARGHRVNLAFGILEREVLVSITQRSCSIEMAISLVSTAKCSSLTRKRQPACLLEIRCRSSTSMSAEWRF